LFVKKERKGKKLERKIKFVYVKEKIGRGGGGGAGKKTK